MTILELRGLSHSYDGTGPVLRGVNLLIEQGAFVGIIGLSGSGKSTLLRCINRLIEPAGGAVLVPASLAGRGSSGDRLDVLRLRPSQLRRLRRKIGMIFQQFNLVKRMSVVENVLSGGLGYQPVLRSTLRLFSRAERRRAFANLKRVGLLEQAYKRADELSGGEQQRVAIARTLMQRPAIILADEPVSSLDPKLSRMVLDILRRICREDGITALVSLHTLELTREYADRVVGLRAGEIVFDGPVSELSAPVIERIYQRT